MEKYFLKTNTTDTYAIIKKYINLDENDFSYTESGNDITITSYIGNNDDVIVLDKHIEMYTLARPTVYKLNVEDYTYTDNNGVVTLTKYTGSGGNIDTPFLEEG